MKVGLYFGSFNPIHVGHLIISEYVYNHTDLEQIWFVVSPQNPFKQQASLLNSYHRLHLVKLAIEDNINLQVSDIEFKLPLPSYTCDTLVRLQEKYPQYQFSIILGSDSFQNIKKWKNADWLLHSYSFFIYERPQFKVVDLYTEKNTVLKAPLLEISSTYIREQLMNKKSIRYMLPEKVYQEVIRNRYYQPSK